MSRGLKLLVLSSLLIPVFPLSVHATYSWESTTGPEGAVVQSFVTTPLGTILVGTDQGGLYRSEDGGETWSAINLAWPCCNYNVPTLAASAHAVYMGTWGGGVYRSDDDGASWHTTGAIPGEEYPIVLGLAVCKHGETLYAGGQFGVARSDDGGMTWSLMINGLPSSWVRTLALRGTTLYARLDQDIYRYDEGVGTWVEWEDGLTSTSGMQSIAATADALFLATHEGGVYHLDCDDNVWTVMNAGLDFDNVDVVVEVDQTLYSGLMGDGVWRWNWSLPQWQERNDGLWNKDVRAMGKHGLSPFAGTWGGGVFRLDPTTDTWSAQTTGMISAATTALLTDGDDVYAGTEGGGVAYSGDQGDTWVRCSTDDLGDPWVWALEHDTGGIYAGTWGGVYKTTDHGQTWSATGLIGTGVFSLGVWGSTLYAGVDGGHVWSSTNGGTSWTEVGSGLPSATVMGLARLGNVSYAALWEHGVYALPDGQTVWTSMNTGLPELRMRTMTTHAGFLFLGTDGKGVYKWDPGAGNWVSCGPEDTTIWSLVSDGSSLLAGGWGALWATPDAGQTWSDEHGDLKPWVPVRALASGPENLFAGLWGDGVWRAPREISAVEDDLRAEAGVAGAAFTVHPNPFASGARVVFRLDRRQAVDLAVYDAAGRRVATIASDELPAGWHERTWNGSTDRGERAAAGVYFIHLDVNGNKLTTKTVRMR